MPLIKNAWAFEKCRSAETFRIKREYEYEDAAALHWQHTFTLTRPEMKSSASHRLMICYRRSTPAGNTTICTHKLSQYTNTWTIPGELLERSWRINCFRCVWWGACQAQVLWCQKEQDSPGSFWPRSWEGLIEWIVRPKIQICWRCVHPQFIWD